MSSNLSKYGVIDQLMVDRLRLALNAKKAFRAAANRPRQTDSLHVEEDETALIEQSLESRLRKSQSPMLVILQLLHEEPTIGSCIADFLGAWAPALRVVMAEKPTQKKESKEREERDGGGDNEKESDDGSDDSGEKESSATPEESGQQHPLHGKHYQTSGAFLRTKSLPSDAHDPVTANRVRVNANRARLVRDLLAVRVAQAEEREQHVQQLMLDGFWTHGKDGGDPNWLLLDYWLSKMALASKYFGGTNDAQGQDSVVDSAGVEHMDESAAASLFGRMQQYTRERRNLQAEHRAIALKTREAFKRELKEAETRREELKETVRRKFIAENEEAKERVMASIVHINKRPGEDGVPPSIYAKPSHPSLLLPQQDRKLAIMAKLRIVEERMRKAGADLAHKRREMSREVKEIIERSRTVVPDGAPLLAQEITDEHDKAEKRKEALASVKEAFKEGNNVFYTKLAEKMANGAQSSLEAIDQRFVESGVFDGDQTREVFDELMWTVTEKKWRVEKAENAKRKLCSDLMDDVDAKMQATNKALFALELDRIERLQQFKDSKTIKPRGSSPAKS